VSYTVYPFTEEDSNEITRQVSAVAPLSMPAFTFAAIGSAVKYQVSAPSFVSVEILNASGRIVYRAPNALQGTGWHTIPLAASGIDKSNGVYIVRCIVNGQDKYIKRVMLMK
jgi:hypothetical protein